MGNHSFQASTKSAMVQKYFDPGLTLVSGFNPEEALRFLSKLPGWKAWFRDPAIWFTRLLTIISGPGFIGGP
jgi:hypothetical protein